MKYSLLTGLLLFLFHIAISCDCDPLKPYSLMDNQYDHIFKGRVIDTLTKDGQGIATFLVETEFMGEGSDTIRIRFDNQSSCLMSFSPGERWLIYAKEDEFRRISVEFCGHSRKYISSDKNQDHYYQVRGTTFEQEDSSLIALFSSSGKLTTKEIEMPFRTLEHPDRGTAIWYILTAIPLLFLLWWLLKRYLK